VTFISSGAVRSRLLTDQFDSEALIGTVGAPVMILHATADSNIPVIEVTRLSRRRSRRS
jgi:hypothetical protein